MKGTIEGVNATGNLRCNLKVVKDLNYVIHLGLTLCIRYIEFTVEKYF